MKCVLQATVFQKPIVNDAILNKAAKGGPTQWDKAG
jgi:hypothetical protein